LIIYLYKSKIWQYIKWLNETTLNIYTKQFLVLVITFKDHHQILSCVQNVNGFMQNRHRHL